MNNINRSDYMLLILYITDTNSRSWKYCETDQKNYSKIRKRNKLYKVFNSRNEMIPVKNWKELDEYCRQFHEAKRMKEIREE